MLAALALVLAAILPMGPASAAGSGSGPAAQTSLEGAAAGDGAATPRDIDQAIAFRSRLGLRADRAFVAGTFGNRAFSKGRWGVPLDPAEASEVGRRADLQESVGSALRLAAEDPASAGAYFDHAAGGGPVFLTAGDPARARSKVQGSLPAQSNARFEHVARSMRALEALQERVNVDLRAGALGVLGVTSTAIDARANAVVVGTAAATDAVRAALVARYGDGLVVVAEAPAQGGDACTTRASCPPAKGGLQIDSTYNGFPCTTSLLVRVAASNDLRLLTAGHCIGRTGGTGTSRKWRHAGAEIGWSELSVWANGADADVGLINVSDAALGPNRNQVFAATNTDIVGLTDWKRTAEQIQGSLVCRAGAMSGYVCGLVTLTNRTKDVDGRTIDHQWVVDFDACPGDSGGLYLSGGIAWGVHTDSTTGCEPGENQAWYSPLGYVWDVLVAHGHPVAMCTEATCGAHVNAWTARGPLDAAVGSTRLISLADERVLSLGGDGGAGTGSGGTSAPGGPPEIFDPATGDWSDAAAAPWLPDGCARQYSVRLGDGRVLVGGGTSDGGGEDPCPGAAYLFDPADGSNGSWSPAAAPPVPVTSAAAVLLDDGRAIVAGRGGADGTMPIALAYDPGADEWATLAAPADAGPGALVLRLADGRVLLSGDLSSSLYTPATNAWAPTTDVGADGAAGVVLANGRVVIAGGRSGSSLRTTVSQLNPSTGSWTSLAALRAGRADFGLVQLPNGQLLAAGGIVGTGASKSVDIFDWGTGAWHAAPSLLTARSGHGATVVDGGAVLAAGGGTDATETYVPGDVLPPVASAPSARLRSSTTLGSSSAPVTVSWSAATDTGGAGVGVYDVARSTDGGAFTTIATSVTGLSLDTTVSTGHTHRFQVRARDWAGNLGGWKAASSSIKVAVTQQSSSSVTWTTGWTTASYSEYSGGSVRYSKTAGKSASYTFTGRGIAFVTSKGPARGSVKIYLDGVLASSVSTYSAGKSYRQVVFQRSWSSTGKHTIKVVVVGTAGHPRVDVDAFVVLTVP